MVRALVVLMVPVILLVALYRFLGHETPPTIDTSDVYEAAQAAHAFDLLKPIGLSDKWHLTSAAYEQGTLRLGFVSPSNGQLRVLETGPASPALIPTELGAGARVERPVEVNGSGWQRYVDGRPEETALVKTEPKRTVIVVGHSSDADLHTLASSLR
jgi:hypothetical protein